MTYDGTQHHMKIQKLISVYEILRARAVPNVDRIAVSFSDDHHSAVAFLEPKGISAMPKTIREVLEAIGCILDALIVSPLHAHVFILWSYLLQVIHEGQYSTETSDGQTL
jgi:hypothetical protein